MAESIPRGRAMVLLGRILNRLVSQWAIPGAGRVAVCSPLVGLIAGLGAVAFLRLLALLVHYVLNGLLHFICLPPEKGFPTRSPARTRGGWCFGSDPGRFALRLDRFHLGP